MEHTNKDYLHYSEFLDLCRTIDAGLNDKNLKILISLLKDIRVIILSISENRRLVDTQILKPEWTAKVSDLKSRISNGELKEVLLELQVIFPNNNEIIVLLARYNAIKSENLLGVLTGENHRKEVNHILLSTLKVIDDFQNKYYS